MKISTLTLATVATLLAGTAGAQTYTVKVGGAYIVPNATSSDFSGQLPNGYATRSGVNLEVQAKATLMFSIERAINDNFGVELVMGLPPKHDVKLKVSDATRAAAANTSNPYHALDQHFVDFADQKVATVKQMAPTLFFNYKFGEASAHCRPYLGLGINYTKMDADLTTTGEALYNGVPMTQKLTSSIAPAVQAGVTYKIDKTWSVNMGLVSTFVSSNLTVSGNGYTHTAKFDFTPTVYTASVGYSF
ncbi:MAG: OmpW family protein [Burkholderiales bacterium]|nr:OmpW family protein [Burkholderiales bacterium]